MLLACLVYIAAAIASCSDPLSSLESKTRPGRVGSARACAKGVTASTVCRTRWRYSRYYEVRDGLDHKGLALYFYCMRPFGLIWFFMWRMVDWTISCGVAVGVLVATLIEILGYAGGGAGEVVGALGLGALIGGFFGVLPGVHCGTWLAVLTLALPRLLERTSRYRMTAVAVCVGALLVPAGLLALLANDYEG